jgi:(2R)-ethylmalonyl-CoA mutase
VQKLEPTVESDLQADVKAWRRDRDTSAVTKALDDLRRAAEDPVADLMGPTLVLARAGGTTGEWGAALREVFGEYRGPTGVGGARGTHGRRLDSAAARARALAASTGSPPRLLVGKPGLDGHSNGAEQIAVAARDAGFEVIYQGIRLTPEQIVAAARDEDVDVVGLSILSGSHLELVPEILDRMRAAGLDAPVVVGGIIPPEDAEILLGKGVAAVFTPKDFRFASIMDTLVGLVERHRAEHR